MAGYTQPSYNIYFDKDDIDGALKGMEEYGYCVIRKMIDQDLVAELKGKDLCLNK